MYLKNSYDRYNTPNEFLDQGKDFEWNIWKSVLWLKEDIDQMKHWESICEVDSGRAAGKFCREWGRMGEETSHILFSTSYLQPILNGGGEQKFLRLHEDKG